MDRNAAETASQQGPDGEGEPSAEPAVPAWFVQIPYLLVMAAMGAGLVIVAAAHFKRGPAVVAGALLLAALLRVLLPAERVGLLAVRRWWVDVLTTVTLAVLLIVLAWVAPQLA
ncbi:DUF3017 domain-containing protein [Haloactinospora alba]|uniref:DUF3017 domain-containing protein n=1 Tax=Haloactinospora alba TaxID=405555 RepID=UPI001FE71B53|nr:DUF3017 domain-containing protein [Haloactinospora alba]